MTQNDDREPLLRNQPDDNAGQIDIPPEPPRSFMNRNPIRSVFYSLIPVVGGVLLHNAFKEAEAQKKYNDALATKLGKKTKEENPKVKSWASRAPITSAIIGHMLPFVGWASWALSSRERGRQRGRTKELQQQIQVKNAKPAGGNGGAVPMQPGDPNQGQGQGHNSNKDREDDFKKIWFRRNPKITAALCACSLLIPVAGVIFCIYAATTAFANKRAEDRWKAKKQDAQKNQNGAGRASNAASQAHAPIKPRANCPDVNQRAGNMQAHLDKPAEPVQPAGPPAAGPRAARQATAARNSSIV